jgi:hypothetical protein
MLDSLVRVSRRDDKRHFVKVNHSRNGKTEQTCTEASLTKIIKLGLFINTSENEPTLSPIGSISAISGTISLSFQSSLHLSLTVLVRYRSPTNI